MVLLTHFLGYAKKATRRYLRGLFIDRLRLHVRGGTGGSGIPRYGGLGGQGGSVYVIAKEGLTLNDVNKKFKKSKKLVAEHGQDSSAKGLLGISGEDYFLEVPTGITVYTENGIQLGEIDKDGSKLLVAKGGIGGCEETGYCGKRGEEKAITLDLKLIADIGLVGFPNAGKSTLLSAVSNARPKIASYPFTTIRPQLGTMVYSDFRTITIADLPGLIEGAHINVGMGHKFLKHVERTKLLLFIVDIQGFQLSHKYSSRSCLETILLLNKELELYKADLLNLPAMLVINKMDTANAQSIYEEIKPKLLNLSNYTSECPEELQPEKVIDFQDIMTTSLIKKHPTEISTLKEKLRFILDKNEQMKLMSEQQQLEAELLEKIKLQTRTHVPVMT